MAITREQVWEVVEAIVAGGKEPTYLLVGYRFGPVVSVVAFGAWLLT